MPQVWAILTRSHTSGDYCINSATKNGAVLGDFRFFYFIICWKIKHIILFNSSACLQHESMFIIYSNKCNSSVHSWTSRSVTPSRSTPVWPQPWICRSSWRPVPTQYTRTLSVWAMCTTTLRSALSLRRSSPTSTPTRSGCYPDICPTWTESCRTTRTSVCPSTSLMSTCRRLWARWFELPFEQHCARLVCLMWGEIVWCVFWVNYLKIIGVHLHWESIYVCMEVINAEL